MRVPSLVGLSRTLTLLCVIGILFPVIGKSQPKHRHFDMGQMDSLRQVLQQEAHDTVRAATLVDLSRIYQLENIDSSLATAERALKLYKANDYDKGLIRAINAKGISLLRQGKANEALALFITGLEMAESMGDNFRIANFNNNIGNIYLRIGELESAREYFFKSLAIHEYNNDTISIANTYNNLGIVFKNLDSIPASLDYHGRSLELRRAVGDKKGLTESFNNLAHVYARSNNWAQAAAYLEEAAIICEETGNVFAQAATLGNLSNVYEEQKLYAKSLEYAKRAFDLAKEHGNRALLESIYPNLITAHKNVGDYKTALETYNSYFWLIDSLREESNLEDMARLESEHELVTKELENEKLREAKARADVERKRADDRATHQQERAAHESDQKTLFGWIAGISIALVLLVLYGFIQKRRDNELIKAQKERVEGQKELIENQKAQVEEKNKEILDSMEYARRLQEAILPPMPLIRAHLPDSFVMYRPKDIVAGDFYWMETVDSYVFFAAADCTGHGIPGALVSVVCSEALNRAVKEFGLLETNLILDRVAELVIETFQKSESEVRDGMDIALCRLNSTTGELQFSGANNPLWVARNGAADMEEVKGDKQPIGHQEGRKAFNSVTVNLGQGDTCYVFSDGFADQFGGDKGKKFKNSNFKDLLLRGSQKTMSDQLSDLGDAFDQWRGDLEQLDDVCVIGVRI